jgi:hypothetical protein
MFGFYLGMRLGYLTSFDSPSQGRLPACRQAGAVIGVFYFSP